MYFKRVLKVFAYLLGLLGFDWLLVPAFSFHECTYYDFCTQWPQFTFGIALTSLGVFLYKNYTVVTISLVILVFFSVLGFVRAGELAVIPMIESTLYQGFIYGGLLVAFIFYVFKNYCLNKNA